MVSTYYHAPTAQMPWSQVLLQACTRYLALFATTTNRPHPGLAGDRFDPDTGLQARRLLGAAGQHRLLLQRNRGRARGGNEHLQPRQQAQTEVAAKVVFNAAAQGTQVAAVAPTAVLDRSGWTIRSDSAQSSNPATDALDGNAATFWHSQFTPILAPLPHHVIIDMKRTLTVNGLSYLPRQDSSNNGNVGAHTIAVSLDGTLWRDVASGTFANDKSLKQTNFAGAAARFVRFTAHTEAQATGRPFTSAAEIQILGSINPVDFTVSASSAEVLAADNRAERAADGNLATFWHSRYTGTEPRPKLPHTFTVDMQGSYGVSGLSYTPRQDGRANGNIGNHKIAVSLDGSSWKEVVTGAYRDNQRLKFSKFSQQLARYVRLTALSEAGNRGPWSSASEIALATDDNYVAPTLGRGQWGVTWLPPCCTTAAKCWCGPPGFPMPSAAPQASPSPQPTTRATARCPSAPSPTPATTCSVPASTSMRPAWG